MAHVATRVLPLLRTYTRSEAESPTGEKTRRATFVRSPAPVPRDLEVAYGMITGVVFGLLAWVGLLLPVLYFLL
jgi:hypothetical protein